ncbi:hypothetical protein DSO57_1006413 [Entomophthora muscae]|uniref:Uncharacterized protein n=1 Tax=Entomophthora muscae TaxID=34485 RepID=A0ACC2UH31_9FUNG|nr:hypothetical protein DSO57_1006413 [Entomophthora muscae]
MDEAQFKGLVVVILNGGCNTGRSMALGYAERGAKVVVHGPKHVVDITVEEIRTLGQKATAASHDQPMEVALGKYGRIDIVAVVTQPGSKNETFDEAMERMVNKTYKGAMDGHGYLAKEGSGTVLIVVDDESEGVAYTTARMSLMGVCKSLANESKGIKCNCVMTVGKRAEENAALAALALSAPSWNQSGCIVEVSNALAQQLLHDEDVAYTYSNSLPCVDSVLKTCLPQPILSVMKDKVAIVTGAGAGLGLMVARRLVALGARVVAYESNMMLRDVPELEAAQPNLKRRRSWVETILLKSEPKEKPKEERYVYINSMDEEEMVKTCISKFGHVDILINCSSVPTIPRRQDLVPFYFKMAIHHHIKASYRMSQHVWSFMSKQKSGHIVNMIPMDQVRACTLSLGMSGLSQALAGKGEEVNIHVNCAISSATSTSPNQVAVALPILLASSACPFQGATLDASSNEVTILDIMPSNPVDFEEVYTVKQLIGDLDCTTVVPPSPTFTPTLACNVISLQS